MSRNTTTRKPRMCASALAALALVVAAGLFTATPARADHGADVSFSFSFGFPAPFIPVPVVPVPVVEQPVYYGPPVIYQPAPPVYIAPRPVVVYDYYADPHYRKHGHGYGHGGWHDRRAARW